MRFRNIRSKPLALASFMSVLAGIFAALDATSSLQNPLSPVFFTLTIVLIIISLYSRFPELYSAPEISIAGFFLFGVLLLFENMIDAGRFIFEGTLLTIVCLAAFYVSIRTKGISRFYVTIILLGLEASGLYLLQQDIPLLLIVGLTLCITAVALTMYRSSFQALRQVKTTTHIINLTLNILLVFLLLVVFVVTWAAIFKSSVKPAPGRMFVWQILLSIFIFLGFAAKFIQTNDGQSKRSEIYRWSVAIVFSFLIFLSPTILSKWALLYHLSESLGQLSEFVWVLFGCGLGVSIILWVHNRLTWQWSALLIGSLGGTLLSYVWSPLAYALTYTLFVPGQNIPAFDLEDALQLAFGMGALILLATPFVAVYVSRPRSRSTALMAASIAGLAVAALIFMSPGAMVSAVASQRQIYGVAFTRVGYDEVGWTSAFAQAVLYIHPWTYGAMAVCLIIALLPASLVGFTLPINHRGATFQSKVEPYLSPSVPAQVFLVSCIGLITIAVFRLLGDKIANTFAATELRPWWKPEWIVPSTVSFSVLVLILNIAWIFTRLNSWKKSSRNSILVCIVGLTLILDGLGIWLIAPEYALVIFLLVGIGVEVLRQGTRLWENPDEDISFREAATTGDSSSDLVTTLLISFIALLPLLAVAVGLALISIVAITELRNELAAPPGGPWLINMLANAVYVIPMGLTLGFLITSATAYLVYAMISTTSDPTRLDFWLEKTKSLWTSLGTSVENGRQNGKRWRFLKLSGAVVAGLLVPFLLSDLILSIVLLFFVSYIYFKARPDHFRKLSWLTYIVAGLILIAGVLAIQVSILRPIGLLVGPALALIYRGIQVYRPDSRKVAFSSLFFPALGLFFSLYLNYQQPVTMIQNGVAKFRNNRWENVGVENSPLVGNKNYRFLVDSQNNLWISGYYGPEALLHDNSLQKIKLATWGSSSASVDNLPIPGVMMEKDGNYYFINADSLYSIVQRDNKFVSEIPNRPRPVQDKGSGTPVTQYGENATDCGSVIIDKNHECPWISTKITSATIDPLGDVWLGTFGEGVVRFHHDKSSDVWGWSFFTSKNSNIPAGQIGAIAVDQNGNIWALSDAAVSVFSTHQHWKNYPIADLGFAYNQALSLYPDRQGRVWVGFSNGIAMWDGKSWQKMLLTTPTSISGFYEDRNDHLWAFSTVGAWMYSNQNWSLVVNIPVDPLWQNPFGSSSFYQVQPLAQGIRKAVEDQAGNLWFGGPQGLVLYDVKTSRPEYFYPSNSGLPSENVQDIQVDSDGALWVSTYTRTVAHRTELPIIGFSLITIGVMLSVIYSGYQRSPKYKALRISRSLANQHDSLLAEIYRTFTTSDTYEVLDALANQPLLEKRYPALIAAFADVATPNSITSADKARLLLKTLTETTEIAWGTELGHLYQFVAQAIQVQSVGDIGTIHLVILRSQAIEKVTFTFNNSIPFELPTFVEQPVANSLEMLGKAALLLRKYLQVDNPQDRLGFIADGLSSVERAKKDAESIRGPENYFIREICNLWQILISRELDILSGHADLRVEFRTKQVQQSDEVTLVLLVKNVGSAMASQVEICILPNEDMELGTKTIAVFEHISAGMAENVEFSIVAPPAGDVRLGCEIRWSDRVESANHAEFADVIRFYDSSGQFERIPNPYIVGHPVKSASLFQGREDVFEFVSHNIQGTTQSHTLVLYGQRRTGKTSILYQLVGGRLGQEYIPVLVDVQELVPGIHSMADLFTEIALHIEKAVKRAGLQPEKIDEQSFSMSPTRSFSRFLTGIEEQLHGRKIVLMFDEFELLDERIHQGKLEPESLGYLRSLMQHRDDLIFMFTGTHKLEQMSTDYWSIFFNIALHQQISFMDNEAAVRLIREPVRGKLSIDDLVVEKMLTLTRGHPYFIQLLCWALVNHCNKKEKNYATLNDLNEVVGEVVSTGESYFAYIWTQVDPSEKIVMSALAQRLAPGKSAVPIQEIVETIENAGVSNINKGASLRILDQLTDQEILVSTGHGGLLYSYRVGLIGEWVKASKPLHHLVEREL